MLRTNHYVKNTQLFIIPLYKKELGAPEWNAKNRAVTSS